MPNSAMVQSRTSVNTKYYVHAIISIAFMVFFRFIPSFGPMTPLGMTILGIFIGALWGWINCGFIWPSVLALIMLGLTDYYEGSASRAITDAIGNKSVQMVFFLLVLTALLTTTGISDYMANRLVSAKLAKGRPWVLSIFLIMAAFVCSALQCNLAGVLICWEFVGTICRQVGFTKQDKWPKMMAVGIAFANGVGLVVVPFAVGVVASFGYLNGASGDRFSYDYFKYILFAVVFSLATMAIFFLFCRFMIRPDMSKLEKEISVGKSVESLDGRQKFALALIIALIVVTVLPSLLPAGGLKDLLNAIGTNPLLMLLIGIAIFFRDKQGKQIFTFEQLAGKGVLWGMLFMVATAMTCSTALSNGDTGFITLFTNIFSPLFEGRSPYIFSLFICLFTLVLTNFINNSIAGALMVPVMYSFAQSVGANPLAITAIICFVSGIGIMLPCASPVGALLSGNEWVTQKDIFVYGSVAALAIMVSCAVVGIPYANLIFS